MRVKTIKLFGLKIMEVIDLADGEQYILPKSRFRKKLGRDPGGEVLDISPAQLKREQERDLERQMEKK